MTYQNSVIILGGAFDPIHNGHLRIAEVASKELGIKDVWFLIANSSRWKETLTPFIHRKKMVEQALKDYPNFSVCLEEEIVSGTTYTINTALNLVEKNPKTKFYYLIGSDQLEKLHHWEQIDDLASLFQFVHINRDIEIKDNLKNNLKKYHVIDIKMDSFDVSSTEARKGNFKNIPLNVSKYIKKHNLYLEERLQKNLSEDLFEHSFNVALLAKELAIYHKINDEKAYIAGLIHDCAKEIPLKKQEELMKKHFPNVKVDVNIYHQFLAPIIAKKDYYVGDKDILSAISKHTTAHQDMSVFDMIIYCADKLEEGRKNSSDTLINMCKNNIYKGFKITLEQSIEYLKSKNIDVSPNTYESLNKVQLLEHDFLIYLIVKFLDDKKIENLRVFDVSERYPFTNYFVLVTASSMRQATSLANEVAKEIIKCFYEINHIEGKDNNDWVLIDAKEVIVHIFTNEGREHYNLEKLLFDLKNIEPKDIIQNFDNGK